ncbi:hypothetical protein EJ05DRAFT_488053 [Pseudovirgaria hyperparasitica]|uniref:FHA domain-containing protein n=1 Tax=Pseudovirgaria hyperparasitica TaxID=470096 RepID=A0A6A6W5D7_9PEZI|nr:uncharacterized protein EJ05DRAFT_488053 [Pseudovirgaria hyperparasitica]KAF2756271.1 hypothetical protein EJ05DRAFT_488053 [Pseudovirgaria hyperparasitica]
MWLLENEGDLFHHKRKWLRPGTRHLLGRTHDHQDGVENLIDAKSVSRRHLLIEISPVSEGDGADLSKKPTVKLIENSKFGTVVDGGEPFKNSTHMLTGVKHTIKLGKWEHKFTISWTPIVFSFNVPSKRKTLPDPLAIERARLEPLGIKTIVSYSPKTTHVIADKRNTPSGLQALVNARHIVTDAYVDAVVRAGTPNTGASDYEGPARSLLEDEFDKYWPSAIDYLPAAGKEPIPRPAEYYVPDPERSEVFAGYTFIFCDDAQYNTLQAPISNGSGKALLYKLQHGQTTPEDFVRYVKNVAGEKGLGEFEDGSEGRGVVCVRMRAQKGWEEWAIEFQTQVQLRLDQRDIEQNEFLDAILMKDASVLRRRLQEEEDPMTSQLQYPPVSSSIPRPPPTAPGSSQMPQETQGSQCNDQTQLETQQVSTTLTRRKPRRIITQSRFKAFDDSDDEAPIIIHSHSDDEMEDAGVTQRSVVTDSYPPNTQPDHSIQRKRPHSNKDDQFAELLPAAAAIKRRRIEAGLVQDDDPGPSAVLAQQAPKKSKVDEMNALRKAANRKNKDIDVREALREQKEAQEANERRRAEAAEEEQQQYDDTEIKALRNLAIIEEMDIKPRNSSMLQKQNNAAHDAARWDDRWNGRKNFKKFRRQGARHAAAPPLRGHKVIVTLEEVKKKDYGIGSIEDNYFLEDSNNTTRGQSRHTSQAARHDDNEDYDDETGFQPRRRKTAKQMQKAHEAELIEQMVAPPRTRKGAKTTSTTTTRGPTPARSERAESEIPPPALSSSSSLTSKGKRAAASAAPGKGPAAKRSRGIPRDEDDDEDDDGGGFKFKRGGRRGVTGA